MDYFEDLSFNRKKLIKRLQYGDMLYIVPLAELFWRLYKFCGGVPRGIRICTMVSVLCFAMCDRSKKALYKYLMQGRSRVLCESCVKEINFAIYANIFSTIIAALFFAFGRYSRQTVKLFAVFALSSVALSLIALIKNNMTKKAVKAVVESEAYRLAVSRSLENQMSKEQLAAYNCLEKGAETHLFLLSACGTSIIVNIFTERWRIDFISLYPYTYAYLAVSALILLFLSHLADKAGKELYGLINRREPLSRCLPYIENVKVKYIITGAAAFTVVLLPFLIDSSEVLRANRIMYDLIDGLAHSLPFVSGFCGIMIGQSINMCTTQLKNAKEIIALYSNPDE